MLRCFRQPQGRISKKPNLRSAQKSRHLHCQLAVEGKGVGVKSVVTLRGADTSPQHKTNKKSKYCFWENGMDAAPDTVK